MGVDRERILPINCTRTSLPVTRRVGFDAEFNAPHVFEVNCPFYFKTFSCKLARFDDERGRACLYWKPESVSENEYPH